MAKTTDLMSLGFSWPLASLIGTDFQAVTTTGTTPGTAAPITGEVVTLTTAGSQTGAILPAFSTTGQVIIVSNLTATGAVLYPPTGATFNTSASTSLAMAQYNTVACVYASATKILTIVSA